MNENQEQQTEEVLNEQEEVQEVVENVDDSEQATQDAEQTASDVTPASEDDIYEVLNELSNASPQQEFSVEKKVYRKPSAEERIRGLITDKKDIEKSLSESQAVVDSLNKKLSEQGAELMQYKEVVRQVSEAAGVEQPDFSSTFNVMAMNSAPAYDQKPAEKPINREEVAKEVEREMIRKNTFANAVATRMVPEMKRAKSEGAIPLDSLMAVKDFIVAGETDHKRQEVVEFLASSNLKNCIPEAIRGAMIQYPNFESMSVGQQCSTLQNIGSLIEKRKNKVTQSKPMSKVAGGGGPAKKSKMSPEDLWRKQRGLY